MFAVEPARLAPFFHLTRKLRDPSDGRRKAKLLWKPTLSARPLSGQESKAEPGSAHIKITFPLLHGFPLPPRKKMQKYTPHYHKTLLSPFYRNPRIFPFSLFFLTVSPDFLLFPICTMAISKMALRVRSANKHILYYILVLYRKLKRN